MSITRFISSSILAAIDSKVNTSDIVNNLTSTATNKPLSAAQGKALADGKVNISDIVNNLTSTATNKPLSAAQGKALSDGKVNMYNRLGFANVEIWDYQTLKRTFSNAAEVYNLGYMYVVSIPVAARDLSGITTMLQIKIPGYLKDSIASGDYMNLCVAANVFIGNAATIQYQIQPSGVAVYPRPNIISSAISNPSSTMFGGWILIVKNKYK